MHDLTDQVISAWKEYVDFHVEVRNWKPYLLSFMFDPLPGGEDRRLQQMARYLEDAYAIFVTRVVRNPTRKNRRGYLPIWLCSPDRPVIKHRKLSKEELATTYVNDGLHFHALLLLPPWSRMIEVSDHFTKMQATYQSVASLARVDVAPITHDLDKVVEYVFKQNTKGRFDVAENFVLPRRRDELQFAKDHTDGRRMREMNAFQSRDAKQIA